MEKLNIQKPNSSVTVTFQGEKFTFGYQTSGQIIDIAVMKARLSENQYGSLQYQMSNESDFALKLIDAYTYFTVMIPELKSRTVKGNLYSLTAEESLELLHQYTSIIPWLNSWDAYLANKMKEISGESDNSKLV